MTRRFALHFAFACNMSKIALGLDAQSGKQRAWTSVPGRFPSFLIICYLQRPENCSTTKQALLRTCSTADLRRLNFFRKEVFLLTCLTFAYAAVELRQETHLPAFLQKGGVPAAPSGTATLLRLSPNHQFCLRPILAVTDFRHPRLSWLDGRCVQGPGTYSPRHG